MLPLPNEVDAEPASRIHDAAVGDELDEVAGLVVVEVVRRDEPQAHRGGGDPLREVVGAELELVPEELDHEVLSRPIVRRQHPRQRIYALLGARPKSASGEFRRAKSLKPPLRGRGAPFPI